MDPLTFCLVLLANLVLILVVAFVACLMASRSRRPRTPFVRLARRWRPVRPVMLPIVRRQFTDRLRAAWAFNDRQEQGTLRTIRLYYRPEEGEFPTTTEELRDGLGRLMFDGEGTIRQSEN